MRENTEAHTGDLICHQENKISEEGRAIVKILWHNMLVASHLGRLIYLIRKRALVHDASKFTPDEFAGFVHINRVAREHEYGSPEYMASIKETDAVALHYSRNSHHPEHYPGGVDDMGLLDIIEMVADWKAASETYGQTSLEDALAVHAERFGLEERHLYLIGLVIEALEQECG
jgi:hypothetical protein